jgi:hypothetical protein
MNHTKTLFTTRFAWKNLNFLQIFANNKKKIAPINIYKEMRILGTYFWQKFISLFFYDFLMFFSFFWRIVSFANFKEFCRKMWFFNRMSWKFVNLLDQFNKFSNFPNFPDEFAKNTINVHINEIKNIFNKKMSN